MLPIQQLQVLEERLTQSLVKPTGIGFQEPMRLPSLEQQVHQTFSGSELMVADVLKQKTITLLKFNLLPSSQM